MKSVSSLIENGWYTFVPSLGQSAEDFEMLLQLQHPSLPKEINIFHQPIPQFKGVLVYGTVAETPDVTINHNVETDKGYHHMETLLQIAGDFSNALVGWIRDGMIDIILMKKSHLLLANAFPCQSTEDIAFHLLNVCQQLRMDPETTPLICYERENKSSVLILQQFFPLTEIYLQSSIYENYQREI